MNKLYYTISILLTSSCISATANAENFYVRADLGMAQSNKVKGNNEYFYKKSNGQKFKKGFAYSVGAGYKLPYNIRAELAYNGINNLKYSTNTNNTAFKQKLKINAFMGNVYYDFKLPSEYCFTPYLGLGLGYAELKPGVASITANKATVNYKAKKSNNFTYAITAGIAYHLNEQFALDAGYKFQDFGKMKNLSSVQLPNTSNYRSYKTNSGFKVRMHSIMAGVRYSF